MEYKLLTPVCLCLSLAVALVNCQLPKTYEYFTDGGITSGLTADTRGFFRLNGEDLRIVSGAIHYFRVHPDYWRDRLRKLRATGANTVETYVPWNLHEPERGIFDFGGGGRDMSAFLDVRRFVQMAQEEDLLVLFRPGPYICAEWEYGGLPCWLQRDPDMKVRTSYQPYLDRVKIYFDELLPHVADLQFTRGGPIIGLQVENEYASFRPVHKAYLELIQSVYLDNGFGESLLFTSDGSWNYDAGSLPGLLLTANFQSDAAGNFEKLLEIQPDRPLMSMEYWAGWFDHWLGRHSTTDPDTFAQTLEDIFSPRFNGSVFYMFHGGTNFGFMAGANSVGNYPFYGSDVTSYDYDAPLSEAGDYTEKYEKIAQLVEQYQVPALLRPERPAESEKTAYPAVQLQKYLTYFDILARVPASARFTSDQPVYMEQLDMNNNSGQSYGYILYRKVFNNLGSDTKLKVGPARDFGILLIDGDIQQSPATDTGYWLHDEVEFDLQLDSQRTYLIDVLVENSGRVGFGWEEDFLQQKGLTAEGIRVDGVVAEGFHILALEFKSEWVEGLSNWRQVDGDTLKGPALFQSTFTLGGAPTDTFLDMRTWHKGIVFVNGFNLGRYFRAGPQQTLYLPAPLLRSGENTIIIFEQLEAGMDIRFTNEPILDQTPGQPEI